MGLTLLRMWLVFVVACLAIGLAEFVATYASDADLGAWAVAQVAASVLWRSPAWVYELQRRGWSSQECPDSEERIAEISTLGDVADLSRPFVVRRAIAGSRALAWNATTLTEGQRGELMVDYFATQGLVPTHRGRLRDVAELIGRGGAKLASERIVREFPELLDDLPLRELTRAFGDYFNPKRLGLALTAPLFWARGDTLRTDLHCEPIASVAVQLKGMKTWTLVDPMLSKYLRPAVAPDGRAYVHSTLDPDDDIIGTTVTTYPGDLLYVPTFWWHRVDYAPDVESMALSLFHFRPRSLLKSWHNRLYIALLFPNLLKELVGWKTQ